MIVQEHGDHLLVIRQTDHAVLSGFLAREWGNDLFRRPELFESFCLAAREHDNGWSEWELAPRIDPKTRVPYTFMSIPTEEHVALYQRGLERLMKADRYAALLVSLYCARLYDRARATIPGFSAKYVKSSESHLVNEFLQRLKLQQLRLKSTCARIPPQKAWRRINRWKGPRASWKFWIVFRSISASIFSMRPRLKTFRCTKTTKPLIGNCGRSMITACRWRHIHSARTRYPSASLHDACPSACTAMNWSSRERSRWRPISRSTSHCMLPTK